MARKVAKIAGYPLFFALCFWFFAVLSFPVERFLPALESRASEFLDREVRIGEISLSLTGRLVFSDVFLEAAAEPDQGPGGKRDAAGDDFDDESPGGDETREAPGGNDAPAVAKARPGYAIDEVVLNLGFWALLFGDLDLGIEFEGLGGEILFSYAGPMPGSEPDLPERAAGRARGPRGARPSAAPGVPPVLPGMPGAAAEQPPALPSRDVDQGDTPLQLTVVARGIELARVPDLRARLPLPISGTLDLEVRLSSGTGRFADAEGEIALGMRDIVLGAGNAEIDVGGMPLTVDPIAVASIDCRVTVKEGTAEFGIFETKSNDFDLRILGTTALADPLKRSRFDLYLMFRFLDGYLSKSDKAEMLVSNIDQFSRDFKLAHRDDGYWGFRYRGQFGTSRFTPSKLAPGEQAAKTSKRAADRKRGSKARRGGAPGAVNLPSGPAGFEEPAEREAAAEPGFRDVPDLPPPIRPEILPPQRTEEPPPEEPEPPPEPVQEAQPDDEATGGESTAGESPEGEIQEQEEDPVE
jgi:hypothetical protein